MEQDELGVLSHTRALNAINSGWFADEIVPVTIASRKGEVIFDRVWGYDFGGESNVLEVYIRYLRQKLEAEDEKRLLHTVRGVGYVLREE